MKVVNYIHCDWIVKIILGINGFGLRFYLKEFHNMNINIQNFKKERTGDNYRDTMIEYNPSLKKSMRVQVLIMIKHIAKRKSNKTHCRRKSTVVSVMNISVLFLLSLVNILFYTKYFQKMVTNLKE